MDPLPQEPQSLNYILKSIRRMGSVSHQPRERKPITFPIMECLHSALSKRTGNLQRHYGLGCILPCLFWTPESQVNLPHHPQTLPIHLLTYCYQM